MIEMEDSTINRLINKNDSASEIYLIGELIQRIDGTKLPSNREVLSVFLYRRSNVKEKFKESTSKVVDEVLNCWRKAHIPAISTKYVSDRIIKLHGEWKKLQKNSKRERDTQKRNEFDFCNNLDDLFDVAHSNALGTIACPQIKQFLLQQREKGRPRCLIDSLESSQTDAEIKANEKKNQRAEQERKRKDKYEREKKENGNLPKYTILISDSVGKQKMIFLLQCSADPWLLNYLVLRCVIRESCTKIIPSPTCRVIEFDR